MKIKSIVLWAVLLMVSAGVARAAHVWEEGYWSKDANAPLYNSEELSLDLFGTYINAENQLDNLFSTSAHHGVWGGGAGVNYFFTSDLGIGVESSISDYDGGHWKFNHVLGDVYFRWPIGSTGLAPYLVGTGGRNFFPEWHWSYGGGVGLEWRFDPKLGIFTDARYLWNDKATALNTLNLRAGLRISF